MNEETTKWLISLLHAEGLDNWTFKVSKGGNMCWPDRKIIDVTPEQANKRGMWLHEIAHALRGSVDGDPTGHDGRFADIFTRLIDDYVFLPMMAQMPDNEDITALEEARNTIKIYEQALCGDTDGP